MPELSEVRRNGVTYSLKDTWARQLADSKYTYPEGGIPRDDLAASVRESLSKADNSFQRISSIGNWAFSVSKPIYTAVEVGALPSDTVIPGGTITAIYENDVLLGNAGEIHLNYVTDADLSGKQDTLLSGSNIKTINNVSILGSGDIDTLEATVDENTETLILF